MNLPLEIPETPTPALEKARRAYRNAAIRYETEFGQPGCPLWVDMEEKRETVTALEEQARKEAR